MYLPQVGRRGVGSPAMLRPAQYDMTYKRSLFDIIRFGWYTCVRYSTFILEMRRMKLYLHTNCQSLNRRRRERIGI